MLRYDFILLLNIHYEMVDITGEVKRMWDMDILLKISSPT